MPKQSRLILLIIVSVLGIAVLMMISRSDRSVAPRRVPSEVAESMSNLLDRLEHLLEKQSPKILKSLRPGLPEARIRELEAAYGRRLPESLITLYQWRDGEKSPYSMLNLVPGHRFVPLEESLTRWDRVQEDLKSATALQRAAFATLVSHRKAWISIFDDGAGDGYYVDTKRGHQSGHFFYNFMETGDYSYFPSVKNFMVGLLEGYVSQAITINQMNPMKL